MSFSVGVLLLLVLLACLCWVDEELTLFAFIIWLIWRSHG